MFRLQKKPFLVVHISFAWRLLHLRAKFFEDLSQAWAWNQALFLDKEKNIGVVGVSQFD